MATIFSPGSTLSKPYFAFHKEMLGPKRNCVATDEDLKTAGRVIYGEESRFGLYGLTATELAARHFLLVGRTLIESCTDAYCRAIAGHVKDLMTGALGSDAESHPGTIYDLFCGSGNISYHIGRRLDCPVVASDLDPGVYNCTRHNLDIVLSDSAKVGTNFSYDLSLIDYRDLLSKKQRVCHWTDIYIIEPPWGAALTTEGLDLTKTQPPVQDIVEEIRRSRGGVPCYMIIKVSAAIIHDSLNEALSKTRFVAFMECLPRYSYPIDFQIAIIE